jgi:D-amino peptidase
MEGLDESFDAALLVGYHSMAGTARAVIAHTFSISSVHAARFNGRTLGESGISAAIAGHFGVPVAMVCGDDSVATRVEELLPWAEPVITKWAVNFNAAKNLTPRASQKRIRASAKKALGRLGEMKPLVLESPIRFELELMQPLWANVAADIPGVERLDGRTLAYTGADMLDVLRIWRLMMNAYIGEFHV